MASVDAKDLGSAVKIRYRALALIRQAKRRSRLPPSVNRNFFHRRALCSMDRRRRTRVFSGVSNFSNSAATGHEAPLSIHVYHSRRSARRSARLLDECRHPNVARHYLTRCKGSVTMLFLDKMPPSFRLWLKRTDLKIWSYSDDGSRVVSMGEDFLSVFKGICEGWKSGYHQRRPHGNLLNGVCVDDNHRAILFDFIGVKGSEQDLKEDVRCLRQLVKLTVHTHPLKDSVPAPLALQLFCDLCNIALKTKGPELWHYSYFVFTNALFFDYADDYQIFHKVWDFGFAYRDYLKQLDLIGKFPEMKDWWLMFNQYDDPQLHDIFVYNKNDQKGYKRREGPIIFTRNCYAHPPEDIGTGCGWTRHDMAYALRHAMPVVTPIIFFKFATTCYADCHRVLGGTTMEFMTTGTHPFT